MLEWARRIVADTRAMREDSVRCAGPHRPSALAASRPPWLRAALTAPCARAIRACASPSFAHLDDALAQLENLEIEAGITYLDNEPLGRAAPCRSIASTTGC